MKAIVADAYGTEDVLRVEEVSVPTPASGEVLIQVHAAGVDQGTWHLMAGLPYAIRLGFGLRRPKVRVPGMDLAGSVVAVGAGVTRLQPGDEVLGSWSAAFAEYACGPEERFILKPPRLTFAQAAALPISGIAALQGLRAAGMQHGQSVLVIGAAGGVGSFAVQLAKALGGQVTAVCSGGKADFVRSLGADAVIDYTRQELTDAGQRWDVIVDLAGNRPLRQLRRVLSPRGALILAGGEGGGRWIGGVDRALRASVVSVFTGQRMRGLLSLYRFEDLVKLCELVESGAVTPAVDRAFALGEAAEAIRYLRAGQVRGKIVITP